MRHDGSPVLIAAVGEPSLVLGRLRDLDKWRTCWGRRGRTIRSQKRPIRHRVLPRSWPLLASRARKGGSPPPTGFAGVGQRRRVAGDRPGRLGPAIPRTIFNLGKKPFGRQLRALRAPFPPRRRAHRADAESLGWAGGVLRRLRRFDLADRAYGPGVRHPSARRRAPQQQGLSYILRGDYRAPAETLLAARTKDPSNPTSRTSRNARGRASQGKGVN